MNPWLKVAIKWYHVPNLFHSATLIRNQEHAAIIQGPTVRILRSEQQKMTLWNPFNPSLQIEFDKPSIISKIIFKLVTFQLTARLHRLRSCAVLSLTLSGGMIHHCIIDEEHTSWGNCFPSLMSCSQPCLPCACPRKLARNLRFAKGRGWITELSLDTAKGMMLSTCLGWQSFNLLNELVLCLSILSPCTTIVRMILRLCQSRSLFYFDFS